jgi:hypothetical protein
VVTNTLFETKVERLFDVAKRFGNGMEEGRLDYRIVGGLAVFMHIDAIDPLKARLTRNVDVAIRRSDLAKIREALNPHGFRYQHVNGINTFAHSENAKAQSAVHTFFIGERVRDSDVAPVPDSPPVRSAEGVLIAPVADLLRMKLTSFRLIDKVHIQDLDSVELITPEIEEALPAPLRERLTEVGASE